MSNKGFDRLNVLDKMLRRAYPVGMTQGTETQLTITKICGFELFNTRSYHNYETWSDGYVVTDGVLQVQEEDLDDAIHKICELRAKLKADPGAKIPSWCLAPQSDRLSHAACQRERDAK